MSDLTPLTGAIRTKKYLVLDIESKDGLSQDAGFTRPFMCGVYDGETYHAFFDDPDSMADWDRRYFCLGGCIDKALRFILRAKYRGWHIYAHNGGRFDYLFLLPWLMECAVHYGFHFSVLPVSSTIQVLDVWETKPNGKRKGDKWRFLDSFKLIPTSLDNAAKGFGLEGKLKHDLNLPETDPRWSEYNKQDCVQNYRVVEKFHHYVENVLLGEVGITAPSTAMKLLRRQYLKEPVPRSEHTHEFIRKGYVGGRCEAFCKKGENLYYYDFNSSYPASMRGMMPAGHATEWDGHPPLRLQKNKLGFVECEVSVPASLHIPVLPVKLDEKLIFPVGRLKGIWSWPELELAREHGAIITHWGHSVWYDPVPLFDEFVDDLYAYRDKSNPKYNSGLEAVVKILLNATYGKFGMKTLRKKLYLYSDPELPKNAVPATGDPDSLLWYADEECDAPYVMPQVSAWVTSQSRILLYSGIESVHVRGGNVYYVDTDSILCDVELPSSSVLGELKNEIPEWGGLITGEFLGPKMYILKTPGWEKAKVKAKGLEADQRTEATLRALQEGKSVQVRRLEKVGTLAREDFSRGPKIRTVPRKMEHGAEKRVMLADGKTKPLYVSMW